MEEAPTRLIDRPVWIVGAVGAAVRLVWVSIASRTPTGLSDPILYFGAANGIAHGDGYLSIKGTVTSYYPPGYPYFLGGVQWLLERVGLGDHLALGAGIVQAVLGGVACGAVVVAGTRLGRQVTPVGRGPVRVGVSAGLVLALWPNLIAYSAAILSETLFVTLFAVFLAAVLTMSDGAVSDRAVSDRAVSDTAVSDRAMLDGAMSDRVVSRTATIRPWRAVTAGVSLGAATLVRPQVLVVAAAMVLSWILSRVGWRSVLVRGAWLAAGVVVVVAPWTVRNLGVFDAFVPVSTNGGDNLCVGFHDGAPGFFVIPPSCDTGEFYTEGPAAELRRNRETRARATSWIRSNLAEVPVLSVKKLWYTYRSDTDGLRAVESYDADPFLAGWRTPLQVLSTVAYLAIMAAALVGAVVVAGPGWRGRRHDATGLAVLAAALASFLVPVLVFGDPRFKVPATPSFALLAGVAVVAVLDRLRRGADLPPDPRAGPATEDDGGQDRPAPASS